MLAFLLAAAVGIPPGWSTHAFDVPGAKLQLSIPPGYTATATTGRQRLKFTSGIVTIAVSAAEAPGTFAWTDDQQRAYFATAQNANDSGIPGERTIATVPTEICGRPGIVVEYERQSECGMTGAFLLNGHTVSISFIARGSSLADARTQFLLNRGAFRGAIDSVMPAGVQRVPTATQAPRAHKPDWEFYALLAVVALVAVVVFYRHRYVNRGRVKRLR